MTVDRDGIAAFAETARHAIAACAKLDLAGCAARLGADGLLGILASEEVGGLGLDIGFAEPAMAAAGAGLLAFPLAETLLVAAALGEERIAAEVIAGTRTATIAWAGAARLSGGVLHGVVGRAPLAAGAELILVSTGEGGALIAREAPGVAVEAAVSLDVDTAESEIVLDGAVPVALVGAEAMARLREDALVLWAAAIGGSAETCMDMAVTHATTREQFGRTLVSFQALRHHLARQKLAVEHIRAALVRHAGLAARGAPEAALARRTCFATATRFGAAAVENAIQVHGGMGFTWDVPLHRHLRRIRAWEAQGDTVSIHRGLADALLNANR